MWRLPFFAVACFLLASGCTSEQLRHNTLKQTSTLPDIQHQVVLTNLATFAYDPYAIPFHATLSDGTTQIQDNGSITSQLLIASSRSLELGLSRTAVDQWSMAPVTEALSLRLLRAAYRRAFDSQVDLYLPDTDLANDLAHELKKQTTTVDDLRTTNQVGNAGLQGVATVSGTVIDQPQGLLEPLSSDMNIVGKTETRSWANLWNTKSEQQNVILSSKIEPNIIGFNNNSIAKFAFEAESVLSSNDDRIVLEEEYLGKDAGLDEAQFLQVKLPDYIAERIELTVDETHRLSDYNIAISDPNGNDQPLKIPFSTVVPKDLKIHDVDMDDPAKAKEVQLTIRKLKALLDRNLQNYYHSINAVASFGVEEINFDKNHIRKLNLVVSFPRRLGGFPNKIVGIWQVQALNSHAYPRYIATTPLVAELRRQVAQVERTMLKIPSGWLKTSRDRHDVPQDACYRISTKDCKGPIYAWVCPSDKPAFEDFTIAILELSSIIKNVNLSGATGVKFTPGSGAPTLGK